MAPGLRLAELTQDLKRAVVFLTRLPLGAMATPSPQEQSRALRVYPVVGAGIGAFGALIYWLAESLNLGPGLAAVLAVAACVIITGGLHEDGWADCADAMGVAGGPQRRLEVMRDSRLGSFGVIALFMALALRVLALASLAGPAAAATALIAVHTVSRGFFPVAQVILMPARTDGLGAALAPPTRQTLGLAAALALLVALLALGWMAGFLVFAVSLLAGLIFLVLARRAFGGYTGDVLGGLQQAIEIAGLLTLVALQ